MPFAEDETLGVRPSPLRTLPLVKPREPLLAPAATACARFFSSSSAFLAAASLRWCSSCSLRSAACCLAAASFSISAMSFVAPCHLGFRISLWLCSVCERVRVHVFSNVEAELTVRETVCYRVSFDAIAGMDWTQTSIFPRARSRLSSTPSMT